MRKAIAQQFTDEVSKVRQFLASFLHVNCTSTCMTLVWLYYMQIWIWLWIYSGAPACQRHVSRTLYLRKFGNPLISKLLVVTWLSACTSYAMPHTNTFSWKIRVAPLPWVHLWNWASMLWLTTVVTLGEKEGVRTKANIWGKLTPDTVFTFLFDLLHAQSSLGPFDIYICNFRNLGYTH